MTPTFSGRDAAYAREMGVSLDCPDGCPNCRAMYQAEANRRLERDHQVTLVTLLNETLRHERGYSAELVKRIDRWRLCCTLLALPWVGALAWWAWGTGLR